MKKVIAGFVVGMSIVAFGDDSSFIAAYDAKKYADAAKEIKEVNMSNPAVARRAGVMYYEGEGVECDKTKGKELLEQAMFAGESIAAVNLAKIYCKLEKDFPKAAWCAMVLESRKDSLCEEDKKDLEKLLRGYLGKDYEKEVVSYVIQLHQQLKNEIAERKKKMEEAAHVQEELSKKIAETEKEKKDLEGNVAKAQEEIKKQIEKIAEVETKLSAVNQKLVDAQKQIKERDDKLSAAEKNLANFEKQRKEKDNQIAGLKKELEQAKVTGSAEAMRQIKELTDRLSAAGEELAEAKKDCAEKSEKIADLEGKIDQVKRDFEASAAKFEEMKEKYERLREVHNRCSVIDDKQYKKLKKEYDELRENYEKLYDGYNDLLKEYQRVINGRTSASDSVNFIRGWNTFWAAPGNFARVFPAVEKVYDVGELDANPGVGFFAATIEAPVLLVCEAIPTALDFCNGFLDMITLGAYGNWLYSDKLTPKWWERDNGHFPWLDRE